ncbi:MAG: hypothetical protein ACFBSF_12865 [Leptolyngbyaceae cyanobacterium]
METNLLLNEFLFRESQIDLESLVGSIFFVISIKKKNQMNRPDQQRILDFFEMQLGSLYTRINADIDGVSKLRFWCILCWSGISTLGSSDQIHLIFLKISTLLGLTALFWILECYQSLYIRFHLGTARKLEKILAEGKFNWIHEDINDYLISYASYKNLNKKKKIELLRSMLPSSQIYIFYVPLAALTIFIGLLELSPVIISYF